MEKKWRVKYWCIPVVTAFDITDYPTELRGSSAIVAKKKKSVNDDNSRTA